MRHLRNYSNFRKFTNRELESNRVLIEGILYKEIGSRFWELSLTSNVFTSEEKNFISENLMGVDLDLLNEGFFDKALQTIKDKGGEFLKKVQDKVSQIKDNIKSVVSGIIDFLKSVIKKIGEEIIPKKELAGQIKTKFKGEIEKLRSGVGNKKDQFQTELENLKDTAEWIKTKFSGVFMSNIQNQNSVAEKSLDKDLDIIEEAQNESINILNYFYKIDEDFQEGDKFRFVNNDGDQVEKEVSKVEGDKLFFIGKDGKEYFKMLKDIITDKEKLTSGKEFFMKWVLKMKETSPPTGGKAKWWIKLILKIVSLCLSPLSKIISASISYLKKNALKFTSVAVSKLQGPGPFEFALLTTISLTFYDYIKNLVNIFEIALKKCGFDVLPEIIVPYIKEYVPFVEEIETFLGCCTFLLLSYDVLKTINEIGEEKPEVVVAKNPRINLEKKPA